MTHKANFALLPSIQSKFLSVIRDCPWFKTFHVPFVYKQISYKQAGHKQSGAGSNENISDIGGLKGKRVILFSAIAKNRSFYFSMKKAGINVLDHLEFKDHYRYKESDFLMINKAAKKVGADLILTTQKDWAKLDQDINWVLDLIVIGIQIDFEYPDEFESLLNLRLNNNE